MDISRGTISTNKETKMVKFINKLTGGEMWIAEDRVEEYKAAGHKPAAVDVPKEKPAATRKPKAKKK